MKTIYMADLDGTLLRSDGALSDYTKTTLNALIERGLQFTVNTSRTPESALSVLKGLNLKLPLILMNGSMFYNPETRETEHLICIEPFAARTAVAVCRRLNFEPFIFSYKDGGMDLQYISCDSPYSKKFLELRGKRYRSCRRVASVNTSGKIPFIALVGDESLGELEALLKRIKGIQTVLFPNEKGDYCFLEIYPEKAGKGDGTKIYKEKYGFQKVVAFGDNLNDIPMLTVADFSVAVANGYADLKKIAHLEIDGCDKDSVANYLLIEWARDPKLY